MDYAASDMRRWRKWALLWAAVVFGTSCTVIQSKAFVHSVSSAASGALSEHGFESFWASWWWVFVKGYHVFEFAVLTVLVNLWLKGRARWVAPALVALYAATDEVHQLWVPERGGRITDWLIDLGGVAIASLLCARMLSTSSPNARRGEESPTGSKARTWLPTFVRRNRQGA